MPHFHCGYAKLRYYANDTIYYHRKKPGYGTTYKCENPYKRCSKIKYVVAFSSPKLLMCRWI